MTELSTKNPYRPPATTFSEGHKICSACQAVIPQLDEFCPKCGVRQRKPANKTTLLLLTVFLGGFGAHRFYLGNYVVGSLYALFFWTMIPGLISVLEFIIFLFISRETIESRYNAHGKAVAVAVIPLILLLILVAIAIPAYIDYSQRTKVAEALSLLYQLRGPAEKYMANHDEFPPTINVIDGEISGKYTAMVISNPQEFYFEAIMKDDGGAVGGRSMRLIFNPKSKRWLCSADHLNGIPLEYLPSNCQE